jgi:transcriptional regulator with XRE-family HTH domain
VVKYRALGQLIEKMRSDAGIAQQLKLANLMGTTQQSVSRWERGMSRPRASQLSELAAVLKCDVQVLLKAGGYVPDTSTVSFAQPFPLHAVSPESFERFCHQMLTYLYPQAEVHRMGGSGHAQQGVDLEVKLCTGRIHSFQCKRHSRFGVARLRDAIQAHRSRASKKFLLLSGVASPAVRKAVRVYRHWDVWDVEDLSLKIRSDLAPEARRRLVDTFFPGQRFALLGLPDPGPWQTAQEFFLPFENASAVFVHSWQLVGRERELASLVERLRSPQHFVTYIVGKGGGGKTRLLKEALEKLASVHPAVPVWLLSPTAELTQRSLEDLGQGPKLLVVDDAHERPDLRLLFQYLGASKAETRLVLLLRPYGLDFVKSQAVPLGLIGEHVTEIRLDDWTLEDATHLATEVLSSGEGMAQLAEPIARLTVDCPLATVVGAFLVAKKQVNPDLLTQESVFRDALLGKFQDVIAGEVGSPGDAESIKKLLRLVSLIQPVYPENPRFKALVQAVEHLKPAETARLFRLLADAGVVIKRSGRYRLSPDLLADFILERNCVGVHHTSTGFAEEVFEQADPEHLEHLLLNLGRLDWRLSNGQPSSSKLLDGVWQRLRVEQSYDDPCVRAVSAVAYYQPERALTFLEYIIRAGIRVQNLATIARHAAYNLSHVQRACALLWELGRNDRRPLNEHPSHPIRVLAEMCAVEPNKPIEYNKVIVEFILSLTEETQTWASHYTPFDVLVGIMNTEGHTTHAAGLQVSFKPFLVRREAVAALRARVIERTLELLNARSAPVAVKAARFLQEAIRFPMGQFQSTVPDAVRASWDEEFTRTLNAIHSAVTTQRLRDVVLIEIARTVSWHAAFPVGPTNEAAKKIIAALPSTLQFRTTLALVDGYGQIFSDRDFERARQNIQRFLTEVVEELAKAYPDGEKLREFVEGCLNQIAEGSSKPQESSSQVLLSMLIDCSGSFARAVVENSLCTPSALTARCAAVALAKVMSEDYATGIVRVEAYLRSTEPSLVRAAAQAYGYFRPKSQDYTDRDVAVLRACLMMGDLVVVRYAIHSLLQVGSVQPHLAVTLLHSVDLAAGSDVADDVFMGLRIRGQQSIPDQQKTQESDSAYAQLTEHDVQHFLKRLAGSAKLDGYWTQTFLAFVSQNYPMACLEFLFARVDYAVANPHTLASFRPCNHGPYIQVPLKFRKSKDFGLVVREVVRRITEMPEASRGSPVIALHAAELFDAVCAPFDDELVSYLDRWVSAGTFPELRLIAQTLRHAGNNFVFEQRAFVTRFLQRAQGLGTEALNDAIGALVSSAVSGVKSGAPGRTPRTLSSGTRRREL